MSTTRLATEPPEGEPKPKKTRSYRSCQLCRSRKAKCLTPDPPNGDPRCLRCIRESKECVWVYEGSSRAKDPPVRLGEVPQSSLSAVTPVVPTPTPPPLPRVAASAPTIPHHRQRELSFAGAPPVENDEGSSRNGGDTDNDNEDNVLLSEQLHNSSDALKLLARASSQAQGSGISGHSPLEGVGGQQANVDWNQWPPVGKMGIVSWKEALTLFSFFEIELAPLYPLLRPQIFEASHLPQLFTTESFLFGVIIAIAARNSPLLVNGRGPIVHRLLMEYNRTRLALLMDGSPRLRHISSVEALLLLVEWPPVPRADEEAPPEVAQAALAPEMISSVYDSMSWDFIGLACRIGQELGISRHDVEDLSRWTWSQERSLQTWIYCINADRHISLRLGRTSVIMTYMSASWWDKSTAAFNATAQLDGSRAPVFSLGSYSAALLAALLGQVQDNLFPDQDVTKAILHTGQWEGFLRSFRHELQTMRRDGQSLLAQPAPSSCMTEIEFSYATLSCYCIALRALQERLRQGLMVGRAGVTKGLSLLNLQEGPWIIAALEAVRTILSLTVTVLEPKGYLRLAPARLFQRILFAATWAFKALAVGVVEHGETSLWDLLTATISALSNIAIDVYHLPHGFGHLLSLLQTKCRPGSRLVPASRPSQTNGQTSAAGISRPLDQATSQTLTTDLQQPSTGAQPSPGPSSFTATTTAAPPTEFVNPNGMMDFSLPWEWNPQSEFVSFDQEQVDFWGTLQLDSQGPDLNLMATLADDLEL
ncbi:hypothetical protein MNV49_000358 [Pseudohyphozyma bogoriensis]|nr:hypothetical protein MNV49_000358 [Pseudohyphozyma bogoriensis]